MVAWAWCAGGRWGPGVHHVCGKRPKEVSLAVPNVGAGLAVVPARCSCASCCGRAGTTSRTSLSNSAGVTSTGLSQSQNCPASVGIGLVHRHRSQTAHVADPMSSWMAGRSMSTIPADCQPLLAASTLQVKLGAGDSGASSPAFHLESGQEIAIRFPPHVAVGAQGVRTRCPCRRSCP